MKKFQIPEMTVVRLSNENLIAESLCRGVTCDVYYCDDCVSCEGTYRCLLVTCNAYGG